MTVTLLLGTAVCVMGCAYNYTVQHKRGEVRIHARTHARTCSHLLMHARLNPSVYGEFQGHEACPSIRTPVSNTFSYPEPTPPPVLVCLSQEPRQRNAV